MNFVNGLCNSIFVNGFTNSTHFHLLDYPILLIPFLLKTSTFPFLIKPSLTPVLTNLTLFDAETCILTDFASMKLNTPIPSTPFNETYFSNAWITYPKHIPDSITFIDVLARNITPLQTIPSRKAYS